MRLLVFFLFCACLFAPLALSRAQACLPTPEAAARSIIGIGIQEPASTVIGFRVKDVQADALTRRVWVRVARCEAPGAPLVLVPLRADLSHAEGAAIARPAEASASRQLLSSQPAAVHAGDPVLVTFASSSMQIEVEATADQPAALGDTLGVSLKRRGDEPVHRMRGILRADHHVEVQR